MSRTDSVYTALREDIIEARLLPDTLLVEAELAERFGMSKTPVREALQVLVTDRLITVIPRKGYVVRPIGVVEAREILDIRLALEPAIVGAGARLAQPEDVEALREALAVQRTAAGTSARSAAAHRFHERLVTAARNDRATAILVPLFDDTTRIHHLVPLTATYLSSDAELTAHERLIDTFVAHDAAAAEQAMREHILTVREITVRGLLGG